MLLPISCLFLCFELQSMVLGEPYESWNNPSVQCRDNYNQPVDWWFLYKPSGDIGPYFDYGSNFTYLIPISNGRWHPSDRDINSKSMLQYTLLPIYEHKYSDYIALLLYDARKNEEIQKGSLTFGMITADEEGGVWIGHSVPELHDMTRSHPIFPDKQMDQSHMIMCLSLDLLTLNEIASMLRTAAISVTRIHIPNDMKQYLPEWLHMHRPRLSLDSYSSKPLPILTRQKTIGGTMRVQLPGDQSCMFKAFARQQRVVLDVYGQERGKETICTKIYGVRNIDSISLKYPPEVYYINNGTDLMTFAVSTAAHWQRTGTGPEQYWVCLSTLAGEEAAKGGVLLCFEDYLLWLAFDNMKIKEPDC